MATEAVTLPDIGDFSGVEIIEILVKPGDRVAPEQSLLTLESEKATMEIPSPFAGVVGEIKVAVGQKVNQGDLLLTLETGGAAAPQEAVEPPPPPARPTPAPAPAAAEKGPGRVIEVRLPDIGDFSQVPVIEILVRPGDRVAVEQSILTVESEKATMEIPCPAAGVVREVVVKVGDKVDRGVLLLTLDAEGAPAAAEAVAKAAPTPAPSPAPQAAQRLPGEAERRQAPIPTRPADLAAVARGRTPHASPAVRRFARELGVDLTQVKGVGPKGRILKEDVQGFVKQAMTRGAPAPVTTGLPFALPPAPEVDFSRFGAIETLELSRIKRLSGAHLHRCWLTVPHVTQHDEADITELEAFRKSQPGGPEGVKLTLLPFLVKAVAAALGAMPNLKSSLAPDGEHLIMKKYTHIGVAVDTPNGLLVPVVRDADQKGLTQLARELSALGGKARDGKLLPADMQGGCFSISSLGGIGGTAFTPIVNAPEVAILGVSRASMKPVWDGTAFVPRLMLPLSLSYDHRVVDGAEAVRFTTLLAGLLGDIRRLLL